MDNSTSIQASFSPRKLLWAFPALVGFAAAVWIVANFWPGTYLDYGAEFYPTARELLVEGKQVYNSAETPGYAILPLGTLILLPLYALPYEYGGAFIVVISMCMLIYSVIVFTPSGRLRPWTIALALIHFHTIDLLGRAQLDAFSLFGIALAWQGYQKRNPWMLGGGYLLMMFIKPQNVLPIAVLFGVYSLLYWKRDEVLKSLTIPAGFGLASLAIFPLWAFRYVPYLLGFEGVWTWETTIWRIRIQFELPWLLPWMVVVIALALAVGFFFRTKDLAQNTRLMTHLMLVLATTFVVTPYLLSYYLVIPMVVNFPRLFRWRRWVGVGLYVLTYLPLFRSDVGAMDSWHDYFFVLAMFCATLAYAYYITRPASQAEPAAA